MSRSDSRDHSPKAIILDLDGVIIDSEPLHIKTEKRLFSEYGLTILAEDWPKLKGLTPRAVFEFIRSEYGLEEDLNIFLCKKDGYLMEAYQSELTLFPDVLHFLERLRERFIFALTTSSRRHLTEWVLTRFRLRDIFHIVTTADDVMKGKPDPEPYARTIEALRLTPGECVVVEDSINGIRSAKGAGAWCIAVTTSFPKDALGLADVIVDNIGLITPEVLSSLQ